MSGANKAEVLRGPFDQGGRPDTRSGQAMFAWNVLGGLLATSAALGHDRAVAA